jgi:hypothetical protein
MNPVAMADWVAAYRPSDLLMMDFMTSLVPP